MICTFDVQLFVLQKYVCSCGGVHIFFMQIIACICLMPARVLDWKIKKYSILFLYDTLSDRRFGRYVMNVP